ncbi:ECF transporter S component [Leuconostoc palmae]|uniref:ECF transporter S component n=1 Tax=Leuconostoc palmae TaxID=501487 RepID=UPI001C7DA59C|nr:ECF transporter S component [Leuconostoc palmae]
MSITSTKTQRLTMIAIFSAISFGLMLFPQLPLIPGADFLKLDFSIVPILMAGYWINMSAAIWTIVLRTLLKLILANEGINTYLGMPVNFLVVITFTIVIFLVMPNFEPQNWLKNIFAIIVATISMTIVAVLVNWFVAVPLYANFAHFDIAKFIGLGKYFVSMVIPFNLVEGIIWGAVTFVILSILKPLQQKISF